MTGQQVPPATALRQLANGFMISQAICVAAKLGIADLLADGPRSCADLAAAAGAHVLGLRRLLRVLASVGVFAEDEAGQFHLTPMAESLQSAVPGSMRAYAITRGEPWIWQPWGALLHGVQTGQVAFEHVFDTGFFSYMADHPEAAAVFDQAMTGRSSQENSAITAAYDFANVTRLVDVGGGEGTLLAAILEAYPTMEGVLFDVPPVAARARERMAARGLDARCACVGGDFFAGVVAGGDAYLLSNVIHDWEDAQATAILKHCRQVMAQSAKLLILETIIPPGNEPFLAKLIDLQMLVLTGGRERTEPEYRGLLEAAGFRLTRVIPTPSLVSVIEGVPA
jgi:O-methyltransferase domain/Dimerisation domain